AAPVVQAVSRAVTTVPRAPVERVQQVVPQAESVTDPQADPEPEPAVDQVDDDVVQPVANAVTQAIEDPVTDLASQATDLLLPMAGATTSQPIADLEQTAETATVTSLEIVAQITDVADEVTD